MLSVKNTKQQNKDRDKVEMKGGKRDMTNAMCEP